MVQTMITHMISNTFTAYRAGIMNSTEEYKETASDRASMKWSHMLLVRTDGRNTCSTWARSCDITQCIQEINSFDNIHNGNVMKINNVLLGIRSWNSVTGIVIRLKVGQMWNVVQFVVDTRDIFLRKRFLPNGSLSHQFNGYWWHFLQW